MFVNESKKNTNKLKDETLLIYYYTLYSCNEVLDIIEPKHKNNKKCKSLLRNVFILINYHILFARS